MKTLGEAALDLPWIAPSVAALTTLARFPLASVWSQLRTDPGIVLLSARLPGTTADLDLSLLDAVLNHLPHFDQGAVDWNQPGPNVVYRACCRHALLVSRLAEGGMDGGTGVSPVRTGETPVPPSKLSCEAAWIAGFLAPLGWLALTAADPQQVGAHLVELKQHVDIAGWQQQHWGHDHTAIARRLSRAWRLPIWLTAILGHLGLHVSIAERLGADPQLFQLVQLAALLIQEREQGLALPVGASLTELLAAVHLSAAEADAMADDVLRAEIPAQTWEAPATHPLLPEFLRMALDNRRHNDAAWIERLQQDLDRMQEARRRCRRRHART